nr:uncharacterized protein LOC128700999 isoform X2 [Cherax quadricarinatus]
MMMIMMMEGIILTVVPHLLLLGTTSASEVNCDSPLRGKKPFFNVPSENNFCLWYKMDEKYTQLNITFRTNVWDSELPPDINYSGVRSNTEEYISITSADILTQLKETSQEIRQINSVSITGNATMEWIKCKNCQSFPNIKTGDTSDQTTSVTVLAVLLVIILAGGTAYIYHLRRTKTHDTTEGNLTKHPSDQQCDHHWQRHYGMDQVQELSKFSWLAVTRGSSANVDCRTGRTHIRGVDRWAASTPFSYLHHSVQLIR